MIVRKLSVYALDLCCIFTWLATMSYVLPASIIHSILKSSASFSLPSGTPSNHFRKSSRLRIGEPSAKVTDVVVVALHFTTLNCLYLI